MASEYTPLSLDLFIFKPGQETIFCLVIVVIDIVVFSNWEINIHRFMVQEDYLIIGYF